MDAKPAAASESREKVSATVLPNPSLATPQEQNRSPVVEAVPASAGPHQIASQRSLPHSSPLPQSHGPAFFGENTAGAPAMTSRAPSFAGDALLQWQEQQKAVRRGHQPAGCEDWLRHASAPQHEKDVYYRNWSHVVLGATSVLLAVSAIGLCYASWRLLHPYRKCIVLAVLLSIALHPCCQSRSSLFTDVYIDRVRQTRERWRGKGVLLGLLGLPLSLTHFSSYACMQLVFFFGFHKLRTERRSFLRLIGAGEGPAAAEHVRTDDSDAKDSTAVPPSVKSGGSTPSPEPVYLVTTRRGRRALRVVTATALLIFCDALLGFKYFMILHLVLFSVFLAGAIVLPDRTFVEQMTRLWKWALLGFVMVGLQQQCLSEAAQIFTFFSSDTPIEEVVRKAVAEHLEAVGPSSLRNKAAELIVDQFSVLLDAFDNASAVESGIGLDNSIVETLRSSFDTAYGALLSFSIARFSMKLNHTLLYYAFAKVLTPMQPKLGELHARALEEDIAGSLGSLLQSFWQVACYHFAVTFITLKCCSFPLPFCFACLSVVLALLPLLPKCANVCCAASCVVLAGAFSFGFLTTVSTPGYWVFIVSPMLEVNDEWLLRVTTVRRASAFADAAGLERKELSPLVVRTALVLGFVEWGIPGLLSGPLIVLTVKALADNWNMLRGSDSETDRGGGVDSCRNARTERQATDDSYHSDSGLPGGEK